jgi:AraC-like DNA-binding protein
MLWGAYVTGVGRSRVLERGTYPAPGHPPMYNFRWHRGRTLPEYALVIVTQGSGLFESRESGPITIPVNSLTVLFPGVWHRYKPANTGWVERYITFNGELVHRLFEHHRLTPSIPVLRLRNIGTLLTAFDRFYAGVCRSPAAQSIELSLRAMTILSSAVERARPPESKVKPSTLNQPAVQDTLVASAIDMIWTRSHRPLSVEQIAEELGVSRRTIERRMRTIVGRSVLEEIHACRLSRAKRLLRETDLAVKTVAFLSGFGSVERLRLGMLKSEKCAPGHFRRAAHQGA